MDDPSSPPPRQRASKWGALTQWLQTLTGFIVAFSGLVAAVIGLFALFRNVIPSHPDSEIVGTWRWMNLSADLKYNFSLADDGKKVVGIETGSALAFPIHMVGTKIGKKVDLEITPVMANGRMDLTPRGYHLIMAADGKTLSGKIYPLPGPGEGSVPDVFLVKMAQDQP